MTILALEFSSARRSVALACDGKVLAAAVEQTAGRSTRAFGLIENVLAQAGLSRTQVEVIATGLGPGSYTGIRAAIALAQGWQLAGDVKVLGVSSVESLAAQAQAEKMFGRLNLVIDAQRGEFYLATWEISGEQRREVSPLVLASAAEITRRQAAGEICAGPEMPRTLFPSAATVAMLACGRMDFVPGEQLEPIYLRATSFVKAPAPRTV